MTIRCSDLSQAAAALSRLSAGWETVSRDSMVSALVLSPLLSDVWRRTPKSLMQRYALRAGQRLQTRKDGSKTLARRVWAQGRSTRTVQRLQTYGQQRLARALMPWRGTATASQLRQTVRRTACGCTLTLSSSLPYARRMHDRRSSLVWDGRPYGRGWSTEGTGGGYISGPVRSDGGRVASEYARSLQSGLGRLA